ncbi:hypothetical protein, partial [Desertihabitans aurantiacus]|uniref:hypothetical protein n=1 Tax=Desertihabitans aurantiacus TaxID=2282477 RepID=UPI001E3606F9
GGPAGATVVVVATALVPVATAEAVVTVAAVEPVVTVAALEAVATVVAVTTLGPVVPVTTLEAVVAIPALEPVVAAVATVEAVRPAAVAGVAPLGSLGTALVAVVAVGTALLAVVAVGTTLLAVVTATGAGPVGGPAVVPTVDGPRRAAWAGGLDLAAGTSATAPRAVAAGGTLCGGPPLLLGAVGLGVLGALGGA